MRVFHIGYKISGEISGYTCISSVHIGIDN